MAQGFAEFLLQRRELDAVAGFAEIFGGADGGGVGFFAHPGDVDVAALRHLAFTAFLEGQDEAVFAYGEADAFCWRAAEELHEAVVAAAAADGVLRAEARGGDFEGGAHVVVEATNEAPVFLVEDAADLELALYLGVVRLAFVAEVVGNVRERGDDGLLAFELGVEDAQWIRVDAALGIGAEFVFHSSERGFEFCDVAAAAVVGVVADGIDVERGALQAAFVEKCHQHLDDLGVDAGGIGAAENLRPNLVELAIAAFLRLFAAEHRPHVIELYGLRQALHAVLDVRPADGGRCLRPQADPVRSG